MYVRITYSTTLVCAWWMTIIINWVIIYLEIILHWQYVYKLVQHDLKCSKYMHSANSKAGLSNARYWQTFFFYEFLLLMAIAVYYRGSASALFCITEQSRQVEQDWVLLLTVLIENLQNKSNQCPRIIANRQFQINSWHVRPYQN